MSSNSKDIDGVALIVEGEDGIFVNVVGGDDCQAREPLDVEGLRDADEGLASNLRKISQIAGVDSDSEGSVAQIVQGHGDGCEVQKAAPK